VAPKWEYQVEIVGNFWRGARAEDIQRLLMQAAEDGWEPVELTPMQNSSRIMLVLRRATEAGSRRRREKTWP